MHPYLKLLQFVLAMAAVQFIGMWVLRRFNPDTRKRAMAVALAVCGMASLSTGLFELRRNPSDAIPCLAYMGMALLFLGIATLLIFMKSRPSAGSERQ